MGGNYCNMPHIAKYIGAQAREVCEWQTCFSSQLPSANALSNVVCRYLKACKALVSRKLLTVLMLICPSQVKETKRVPSANASLPIEAQNTGSMKY
jgi:hypothetical protein